MAKHKVYKTNPARKYIILSLFIFLFIGVGYSVLSTSLGITGNVNVWKHDQTLYGVLEYETRKGTYAKKYTKEHQDSMNASLSNRDIYYWYGTDSNANTIKDKWNVIFANHCWQMYRTTDTGGVKLIYNGEVENNQCLNTRGNHLGYDGYSNYSLSSNYWYGTDFSYDSVNKTFTLSGNTNQATWNDSTYESLLGKYTCKSSNLSDSCSTLYYIDSYNSSTMGKAYVLNSNSHYSQFGSLPFNSYFSTIAYVGYMYNKVYRNTGGTYIHNSVYMYNNLSTTYWYADDMGWDTSTRKYYLINPYQINSEDDFSSLVGKYTFANSSQTYSTNYIQYISAVEEKKYYYLSMNNGSLLNSANITYTYGDGYTDNGNGTYTITNPTTIYSTDYFPIYSSLNNKYICKNATNNTCSNVWYITYTNNYDFLYVNPNNNYIYASGFTYSNGSYTLNNDRVTFWNYNDSENKNSVSTHHYTCFNSTGECSTLNYVYTLGSGSLPSYIELNDGKGIDDALDEMLYDDDVNTIDSVMKKGIEWWFEKELIDYSDYLEDTVFCADRSIGNFSTTSWNPNGGSISVSYIYFSDGYLKDGLNCLNETDQFSVSNPKATLRYNVGLMTYNESGLLNSNKLRLTEKNYWLLSPMSYFGGFNIWNVNTEGKRITIQGSGGSSLNGVRPVVSLKPGTLYTSGDGSMANPYVVSTN